MDQAHVACQENMNLLKLKLNLTSLDTFDLILSSFKEI